MFTRPRADRLEKITAAMGQPESFALSIEDSQQDEENENLARLKQEKDGGLHRYSCLKRRAYPPPPQSHGPTQ